MRTALVVLMVFIPTCAMAAVAVVHRTGDRTREQRRAEVYGQAVYQASFRDEAISDVNTRAPASDADVQRLLDAAGPGAHASVEHNALDRVSHDGKRDYIRMSDVDLANPLVEGRFRISEGHAPRTPREAAIEQTVAKALRLKIGSVIASERRAQQLRVVGVFDVLQGAQGIGMVVVKSPLGFPGQTRVYLDRDPGGSLVNPDFPADRWIEVQESYGAPSDNWRAWNLLGGAVGLMVLGTVIAAAFALGARRQLHTIGLLSASGAPPSVVAWSMVAQGALAGVVGGVLGVAVAFALGALAPASWLRDLTHRPVTAAVIRPLDAVPIIAVSVLAAIGASLAPARTAARLPTLQALGARRPLDPPSRRSLIASGALFVGGALAVAWALDALRVNGYDAVRSLGGGVLGAAALVVGVLLLTPHVIVWVERRLAAAPLAWRLAGRSVARNRTRSASVIGATCVVVGAAVAATSLNMSWATSLDRGQRVPLVTPNQVVAQRFQGAVPAADLDRVRHLVPRAIELPMTPVGDGIDDGLPHFSLDNGAEPTLRVLGPFVSVATPRMLDVLGVSRDLRAGLAQGGAITVRASSDDSIHRLPSDMRRAGGPTLHVVGEVVSDQVSQAFPQVLIARATADRLGWSDQPSLITVFVADHPLSKSLVLRVNELMTEFSMAIGDRPSWSTDETPATTWVIAGFDPYGPLETTRPPLRAGGFAAIALFVLAVVGGGLALSERDAADERAVFVAVGGDPRAQRRVGTRRATLVVGIAVGIAIPVAVAATAVVVTMSTRHGVRLRFDWFALGAASLGLPSVVAIGTLAGGWLRDRMRASIPDAFAFAD